MANRAINAANFFAIDRIEPISLVVKSVQNKITFPDVENLRGKTIVGLEVKKVSEVTKDPNGADLISDAVFKNSFLTLAIDGGEEIISETPLSIWNAGDNDGKIKALDFKVINWPKSFVKIGDTAGLSTGETFFFSVYYLNEKEDERRQRLLREAALTKKSNCN